MELSVFLRYRLATQKVLQKLESFVLNKLASSVTFYLLKQKLLMIINRWCEYVKHFELSWLQNVSLW